MDTNGAYLQTYVYRNAKGGWCKSLTYQGRGVITFANAEAMCVNNALQTPIKLRVSGEVEINPASETLGTGYSLIGNMTPSEIDIQDIVPYDLDGNVIEDAAKVGIQKMDTTGAYLQTYVWRNNKGGWCKSLTFQPRGTIVYAPGESACVNNATGKNIVLKFKSPIAE